MVTAGIYARISLDRNDGEGVDRQLADCRALVAGRGWDVVEYVDNDLSAYRAKRRPEWLRLLADVRTGQVQVVVAYHVDRLYRHLPDLELLIDALGPTGAEVLTTAAGEIDLTTASGRMVARIMGSVARHESERMGERVSRAKQERAAQGRPAGGGRRPFGLDATRTVIVMDEAVEARRIAEAIRTGASSWVAEVRRMNAEGKTTTAGRPWTVGTLRRALTSPYIAGLRSYQGEVVGSSRWPAILDRETWDDLRALAASRQRGRPPSDQHLLTGLLACGLCGARMYGKAGHGRRHRSYVCPVTPAGTSCGRISMAASPLEGYVEGEVLRWLADPVIRMEAKAYLEHGTTTDAEAHVQRDEIERRLLRLAERWAAGEIGDAEYEAAQAVLRRRRDETDARILSTPRIGFVLPEGDMAAIWGELHVPEKRALLEQILTVPVQVQPAVRGRPYTERVNLLPTWR